MKELIEYFAGTYIINLTDRPDRRSETIHEFRRIGIDIPNEKVRFYSATRPAEKGVFLSIGNRGCYTSHRSVLELALKENLRNLLVIEDDIQFNKIDSSLDLQAIAQLDREEWDLVFFGNLHPIRIDGKGPLLLWNGDIRGSHCYAINGRFIGEMVEYLYDCEKRPQDHPDGGPMPLDGAYNHIRYLNPNIRLFVSTPNFAAQRSSLSDSHPSLFLDRFVSLRPFIRCARLIKNEALRMLNR